MVFVTTLDVKGLTSEEYRAVLDEMGVEIRPAADLFLHLATKTDTGYRIVEIWNGKKGFEEFLERRLAPAAQAVNLNRHMEISITPLHNFFAPRLLEIPGMIPGLPGAPDATKRGVSAGERVPNPRVS